MRACLVALALAVSMTLPREAVEPALQIAQMARDVTDAVRKQRARKRARLHQHYPSEREIRR